MPFVPKNFPRAARPDEIAAKRHGHRPSAQLCSKPSTTNVRKFPATLIRAFVLLRLRRFRSDRNHIPQVMAHG